MSHIGIFPDVENALLYALVPLEPDIRFVTALPAGDSDLIICRIHRQSGANRDIYIDRPIVDVDVYGLKSEMGSVSNAARDIQTDLLSMASKVIQNGVITHVTTIVGPRQLPEPNVRYVRYGASYEIKIHS